MKKSGASRRRCFALAITIAVVAALGTFTLIRYLQPRFDGKTLDEWVSSFPLMVDGAGNELFKDEKLLKEVTQAGRAIREFGPDALSRLERELRATDSRLGLARFNLEVQWANTLRRNPTYVPAALRRARAMSALSELGTLGSRYAGELKIAATNKTEDPVVRGHARWALEKLAPRELPAEKHRGCMVNYEWCGMPDLWRRNAALRVNRFYEVPEENDFVLVGEVLGNIQPGDYIRVPNPEKPGKRFNVVIRNLEFSTEPGSAIEIHIPGGPSIFKFLQEIQWRGETFEVEGFRESRQEPFLPVAPASLK
jgi:hypothetical protein